MTPERLEIIARTVNAHLDAAARERQARLAGVKSEVLRLETEAANLAPALAQGLDSATVRAELASTESSLAGVRAELAAPNARPRARRTWFLVQCRLALDGTRNSSARNPSGRAGRSPNTLTATR